MTTIGKGNWVHRQDLAVGKVRDVWYCKDYGVAVKTRLGWFAGNGHACLRGDLGEMPELIEPRVGPCRTHVEAISGYDAAMGAPGRRK